MTRPPAIGFLFNHEGAHQVAHALPIAAAIADMAPQVQVRIFVAPGAAEDEVRRQWHPRDPAAIVPLLAAGAAARAITRLSGNALPAERLSMLRANLDRFAALDALVVPEKTSLLLKTRLGLTDLKLIHTRHGAGDRAIGFDRASAGFDYVLLSGQKVRDRLTQAGTMARDGSAIVGYPKFDTVRGRPRPRLFDNDRPTVVYNPHPSPALSSWYAMGAEVLDWFAAQDRFNLVFAPHLMLFRRRTTIGLNPPSIARVGTIAPHIAALPHIRIDTGSAASVDMTYTDGADIYLGDASSQIYEFLKTPRPAIFLNPRGLAWEGDPDFAHWRAGPVVGDVAAMAAALDDAVRAPDAWRAEQERLFAYTFDLTDEPSAVRAARAILAYLAPPGGAA